MFGRHQMSMSFMNAFDDDLSSSMYLRTSLLNGYQIPIIYHKIFNFEINNYR